MRCHRRQERTDAAADVTPVRANRVADMAVELQLPDCEVLVMADLNRIALDSVNGDMSCTV